MRGSVLALAIGALALPRDALAHPGRALAPHDLAGAWLAVEPGVLLSLGLLGWLYARGLRALWSTRRGRGLRRWEARAFLAGWLALVLAMLTPLHPLGEALFSAHMVQHVLLMVVAAPLLVLGRPLIALLWAVPIGWRRTAGAWARTPPVRGGWRALTNPLVAFLVHGAAIWIWHVPALYELSLDSEAAHTAQHASFLGTALLFWWSIVHGRAGRAGYGAAVLYLFATTLHSGALGALLTFTSEPWYPAYRETTAAWGLTPLEDQQLAGLIMWIPAGISYLIAGLVMLAAWIRESERRTARWQERASLSTT